MLNSLTWYLIFVVQTACSLCCKLVYTSSQASMEQFSQGHWEAVSWALSPKHSHQKKKKKNYFKVVTILFGRQCFVDRVLQNCFHYYCKSWYPHITMWLETYLNEVIKELLNGAVLRNTCMKSDNTALKILSQRWPSIWIYISFFPHLTQSKTWCQ